jgi:hypothetical protein
MSLSNNTSPTVAICIWGEPPNKIIDYQEVGNRRFSGSIPTVFTHYHTDPYKSLWLTNNIKRQHEITSLTLFDIVLYMRSDVPIHRILLLPIQKVNPNTVYYLNDQFTIFYCDSMAGDLASLYNFNNSHSETAVNDFTYHLNSYKLNLKNYHR